MQITELACFSLQCLGNNLFVGAGNELKDPLKAIYNAANKNTYFRFDDAGGGELKLYGFYHSEREGTEHYVSGYGYIVGRGRNKKSGLGWVLRPSVADEQWSRFSVVVTNADPDDFCIQIRSTSPTATRMPWVQIIDETRLAAIAMSSPYPDWGTFRVVPVSR